MAKSTNSIASMNATEQLYGHTMTKSRVFRMMFSYELAIFVSCFILYGYNHLIWAVLWMAITAILVYKKIIPRQVQANYEMRGEIERNKFINIATQSLSGESVNLLAVLRRSNAKLEGEFHDDMESLIATMASSPDNKEVHKAFTYIEDKYKQDIYFCLFMEQIETVFYETQYHIETFEVFKDSHNVIMQKEKSFSNKKRDFMIQGISMFALGQVLNAITLYSSGYDKFLEAYANIMVGPIISAIYLTAILVVANIFVKRFFDDDVTHY